MFIHLSRRLISRGDQLARLGLIGPDMQLHKGGRPYLLLLPCHSHRQLITRSCATKARGKMPQKRCKNGFSDVLKKIFDDSLKQTTLILNASQKRFTPSIAVFLQLRNVACQI